MEDVIVYKKIQFKYDKKRKLYLNKHDVSLQDFIVMHRPVRYDEQVNLYYNENNDVIYTIYHFGIWYYLHIKDREYISKTGKILKPFKPRNKKDNVYTKLLLENKYKINYDDFIIFKNTKYYLCNDDEYRSRSLETLDQAKQKHNKIKNLYRTRKRANAKGYDVKTINGVVVYDNGENKYIYFHRKKYVYNNYYDGFYHEKPTFGNLIVNYLNNRWITITVGRLDEMSISILNISKRKMILQINIKNGVRVYMSSLHDITLSFDENNKFKISSEIYNELTTTIKSILGVLIKHIKFCYDNKINLDLIENYLYHIMNKYDPMLYSTLNVTVTNLHKQRIYQSIDFDSYWKLFTSINGK